MPDTGIPRKLVPMPQAATSPATLKFLEDRWDPSLAATFAEPDLLRYRSNLLGSDLRITNFAGGKYYLYNLSGPVDITIVNQSYPNAVFSGFFTD